jgi:hypothetical protein
VKKTAFLALAVAVLVAGAFLLQCDLGGGDDSGGSGADTDLSNYYTKDQVYTKSEVLGLMPTSAGETYKGLYYNATAYASGLPFNNAAGKDFVMLFIWNISPTPLGNTEADAIKICFGANDADAVKYPLPINFSGTQTMLFPVPAGTSKVWAEGTNPNIFGAGNPDKVRVIPIWFTGGQF